ncbi:MAG: hypothetical protein Q7T62_14770 [Undibacterium sp.]|nr:hypothetical protein [Undibacterium sp.]
MRLPDQTDCKDAWILRVGHALFYFLNEHVTIKIPERKLGRADNQV